MDEDHSTPYYYDVVKRYDKDLYSQIVALSAFNDCIDPYKVEQSIMSKIASLISELESAKYDADSLRYGPDPWDE
jgi:hypothetical protein